MCTESRSPNVKIDQSSVSILYPLYAHPLYTNCIQSALIFINASKLQLLCWKLEINFIYHYCVAL